MKKALSILLLFGLAWCGSVSAANILLFGDSLSASYGVPAEDAWSRLLQQKLVKNKVNDKIINLSIPGETTYGGVRRLEAALNQYKPSIVMLELGGNDGLRGFPLKDVRANLARMVKMAKQHHARVLLIGITLPNFYGPQYIRQFEQMYINIATREHTDFMPMLVESLLNRPELLQSDGIHPTREAQPLIANNVWQFLAPLVGHAPH